MLPLYMLGMMGAGDVTWQRFSWQMALSREHRFWHNSLPHRSPAGLCLRRFLAATSNDYSE